MEYIDNYTVIDIETTGLNPIKDNIIELSALKIRNNKIVDKFSELINPRKEINYFVSNLTGITNNMLTNAKDISEVLPKFMMFVKDDIVLGHNVKFDVRFIKNKLYKYFEEDFKNQTMDTLNIARKNIKLTSYKLENIAKHFNIDTYGNHRGLKDCYITFEVYNNIRNTELSLSEM